MSKMIVTNIELSNIQINSASITNLMDVILSMDDNFMEQNGSPDT